MKTVQFTGDERHVEALSNFHKNTWNDTDTLRQSETRVYVLDTQDISIDKGFEELTEEEWIAECERQGRVYSLQGFARAFNEEEISTAIDAVKIINVIKFD